jgi:hypothetical protein
VRRNHAMVSTVERLRDDEGTGRRVAYHRGERTHLLARLPLSFSLHQALLQIKVRLVVLEYPVVEDPFVPAIIASARILIAGRERS